MKLDKITEQCKNGKNNRLFIENAWLKEENVALTEKLNAYKIGIYTIPSYEINERLFSDIISRLHSRMDEPDWGKLYQLLYRLLSRMCPYFRPYKVKAQYNGSILKYIASQQDLKINFYWIIKFMWFFNTIEDFTL